jgi:hypothetical protein
MTAQCPHCDAKIQRRADGNLLDGLNDHLRVVHSMPPRERLPRDWRPQ